MTPGRGGLQRVAGTTARILVSGALLALLLYLFRSRLPGVLDLLTRARPGRIVLALVWYLVFVLVSSWRWQILLGARGMRFSTWYLARVFVLSLFFCKLLPTSIGGDVFRIAYTAPRDRTAEALSATLLDRLIGFISLLFLAAVVSLGLFVFDPSARVLEIPISGIQFRGLGIVATLAVGLALLVVVTLVFFNDHVHQFASRVFSRIRLLRLGERLDKAYDSVKQYRHHHVALFLSFLSGIAVQAALALSWHGVAASIGGTVPLAYYFVFIPILNIVVNIPTIGGLGVREWAFVLLFTPGWLRGALAEELALATALLFLALDLVFALIGGMLFAIMRRSADGGLAGGVAPAAPGKEDGNAAACSQV